MIKKNLIFIFIFIIIITGNIKNVKAEEQANNLDVSAKSAILICADSGSVIYSKNDSEKLPMASTTKIMTALLTLEASQAENKQVAITQEMVTIEGSSMGLQAGDVLNLDGLAKGMLSCSGNDAANSAAIAISGSPQEFAKLMNERAKQIGMTNTNFVTPSGLDDENHYSTAYDMALLGAYAMENQSFSDIVSQKSVTVDFINPKTKRSYANHNRLITLYKGCIGIKTGFTKKSGRCLVSCAQRDNVKLVAVTLNAPDDWNDHIKLYDYGFNTTEHVVLDDTDLNYEEAVVGSDIDKISVNPAFKTEINLNKTEKNNIQKQMNIEPFLYAPVKKGQIVGNIEYKIGERVIARVNLVSSNDANEKKVENVGLLKKFFNLFKSKK